MNKLEKYYDERHLSDREIEVACLIVKGLSNKEAASCLNVTEKTIKFHLTHIYKKMKVKSRAQLTALSFPYMEQAPPPPEILSEPEPPKKSVAQPAEVNCSGDLPRGNGAGYKV